MKIESIKVLYPQCINFLLERKNIGDQYIFLYFQTPVIVYSKDGSSQRVENAFMILDKFSYQKFLVVEKILSHDWMHITGNLDEAMTEAGLSYNTVYKIPNGDFITKIMHNLELEFLNTDEYSLKLTEYNIKRLLILLGRAVNTPNTYLIHSKNKDTLIKTRAHIRHTYSADWTIEKMAQYAHLSPSRFCELYSQLFKIPPKKDLQNIRIDHAKTLLISGNYTVREVAEMIGYETEYYFIRKFKQITGITPGQYIKKYVYHQ
jgi:AraC-like DNA-binding protein